MSPHLKLFLLLKILQYTVTMFLVDTSPSMGKMRTVDLPPGPNDEPRTTEMTNLDWALQFVKLKIQEMVSPTEYACTRRGFHTINQIFNGRKTDQCGVILFGSKGNSASLHLSYKFNKGFLRNFERYQ